MNVGDRVKYREGESGWSGNVAGIEDNVVLLELGVPTPFLQAPEGMAFDAIDERMHLPETKILGYGLRQSLEDNGKLPSGRPLDAQERLYELDRPMKISDIKEFCSKTGESPHCWWHGLMMTAVPIDTKSRYFGSFEEIE